MNESEFRRQLRQVKRLEAAGVDHYDAWKIVNRANAVLTETPLWVEKDGPRDPIGTSTEPVDWYSLREADSMRRLHDRLADKILHDNPEGR
jgi:hypothetical protein